MSSHLLPCPACNRHVQTSESACPFCQQILSEEFRATRPRALPCTRLTRAAVFAVGASLAAAPACGDETGSNDGGMADASAGGTSGAQGGAGGGAVATGGTGGSLTGTGGTGVPGTGGNRGTGGVSGSGGTSGAGGSGGNRGTDAGADTGKDGAADAVVDTRPPPFDGGGVVPVYGAPPVPLAQANLPRSGETPLRKRLDLDPSQPLAPKGAGPKSEK
jgi:hypothetical protein